MLQIDVHIASLRNLPLAELPCLGGEDRARLERITHERARRSFLGGRHLLQWLLPGQLPALKRRPGGKPVFDDASLPAVSLSHSCDRVACALLHRAGGAVEIGVDIERAVDRPALFASFDSLFPQEAELLEDPDAPDDRFNALRLWTLKEAVAKVAGSGLAGFDRISLRPCTDDTVAGVRSCRYAHWILGGWHLGVAWQGCAPVRTRIFLSSPTRGRSRRVGPAGEVPTLSGEGCIRPG